MSEADPLVGRDVGRYRVLARIAAGGFAKVYLAVARGEGGFGRRVALKMVHPQLAEDPRFVEMLLDEARLAALVDHPHVCRVFDAGVHDDAYYIVMDYVAGEPLSAILRALHETRDATPVEERRGIVARLLADVAKGLDGAHEARSLAGEPLGLVHRDVAPQNVFVRFDGMCQLIDFGIAKGSGRLHRSATGIIKGHFAYIAPEQLAGRHVDRRADLFSFGVIAWEAFALQRLFARADEASTLMAVAQDPIEPLTSLDPAFDPELAALVHACLERDPERRPTSAREVADRLERWLARASVFVTHRDIARHMQRWFPNGDRHAVAGAPIEERAAEPVAPSRALRVAGPSASTVRPVVGKQTTKNSTPLAQHLARVLALGVLVALVVQVAGLWPGDGADSIEPIETASSPRARPSLRAPIEEGEVSVVADGQSCRVYYRDALLGDTPGRFSVPSGSRTLRIECGNEPAIARRVRVPAGGHVGVRVR